MPSCQKEIYYSETARKVAEELEVAGLKGPYLQELKEGKPTITELWEITREAVKHYQENQERLSGK